MPDTAMPDTVFIGNDIYRRSRYGRRHPLAIPRVSTVIDLARALHWLTDADYIESPMATPAELARFHDPVYIAAVQTAELTQKATPELIRRHNIGKLENPVYGEIFRRPATAVGASLLAADLVAAGRARRVHSPAGGTHHGRSDRAAGFCYFNDPVLCLLRLQDHGIRRIAYVDLDAHHCDGVEDATHDDPGILTLSVHEHGRWPHVAGTTGRLSPTVGNFPLPRDANDSEFRLVVEQGMLPRLQAFAPEVVILQCGADALTEDPLSRLTLSNRAIWRAVRQVERLSPRLIVLGGGGYNPWSVARCWTGIWGLLKGLARPARLPAAAEAVLRQVTWHRQAGRNPPDHWFTTLADAPRDGPVRTEVRHLLDLNERAAQDLLP